jgi:hypothetical protein
MTWLEPDRAHAFRDSCTSIGIMGLMLCAYFCWLPWVAFKRQNHGMLPECPVIIPFFFAHIKSSNKHWQRYIKVMGGMAPMLAFVFLIIILIFWKREFNRYRERGYQPKLPELPDKPHEFDLKSEWLYTLLP